MPEKLVVPPGTSALAGARPLAARLREEAARQVAFSEVKRLLREAASVIERLEAKLSSIAAELGRERTDGRTR